MDKNTKIELLKILGMVIILVVLILGIVWLNSDPEEEGDTQSNTAVVEDEANVVDDQTENEDEQNTVETSEDETTNIENNDTEDVTESENEDENKDENE